MDVVNFMKKQFETVRLGKPPECTGCEVVDRSFPAKGNLRPSNRRVENRLEDPEWMWKRTSG